MENNTHLHTHISNNSYFFIEGSDYMFTTDAIVSKKKTKATAAAITTNDAGKEAKTIDPDRATHNLFVPWYDNNDFPHALIEKMGKLTVGRRAITNNADMHVGAGVLWVKEDYDSTPGKVVYKPQRIPDWQNMVRQGVLQEHGNLVQNLEMFYWGVTQFIFNKDRTKINRIVTLKTAYCRFEPMDKNGNINAVIYSAKFPDTPAEGEYTRLPIFDPNEPFKYPTCVFISSYGSLEKLYYPMPDYYAVFANGWVDVAITVPKIINAIYKNASTIKWHIHIPIVFFTNKYKDWDSKTEEDQIEIFKTEQRQMESFLSGADNSGKAFVSLVGADGWEKDGWKFEPLKNYLESTQELPNTTAADKQILYALGFDPGSLGVSEKGTSNLGGSGSSIRNGVEFKQSTLTRERWDSLAVLNTIAMVNGYPEDVFPVYKSSDMSQTLDQNPTGSQTVIANT